MIVSPPFSIHVELDAASNSDYYYGFARPRLAAFTESQFVRGGLQRTAALSYRFFDALEGRWLRTGVDDPDAWRGLVAEAGIEAALVEPDFSGPRHGHLTFTVLAQYERSWRIFNLGTNFVLHIHEGVCSQVITPHSQTECFLEEGMEPDLAYEFCSDGTAGVQIDQAGAEDRRQEMQVGSVEWLPPELSSQHAEEEVEKPVLQLVTEIRQVDLELGAGEWLLVVPPSKGILDLDIVEHPRGLDALRSKIVEALAAPYSEHNRSWLAIGQSQG